MSLDNSVLTIKRYLQQGAHCPIAHVLYWGEAKKKESRSF